MSKLLWHTHASLYLFVFKLNTSKEGKLNNIIVFMLLMTRNLQVTRSNERIVWKGYLWHQIFHSVKLLPLMGSSCYVYATQPSLCSGCNLSAYLMSHRSRRSILSFPSRTVKQLTHPWSQPSELKNPVILLATSASLIKQLMSIHPGLETKTQTHAVRTSRRGFRKVRNRPNL